MVLNKLMIRRKSSEDSPVLQSEMPSEVGHQNASANKPLKCARAAIDKKAENIKVLNLTGISSFTDYFVICSGTSDRQVQAIADSVKSTLKKEGSELVSIEGYGEGRWILMDFGDVVVHIFQDALREYYDLEALWMDAPKVQIPTEYYLTPQSQFS
jgi:ribosome-associated protein